MHLHTEATRRISPENDKCGQILNRKLTKVNKQKTQISFLPPKASAAVELTKNAQVNTALKDSVSAGESKSKSELTPLEELPAKSIYQWRHEMVCLRKFGLLDMPNSSMRSERAIFGAVDWQFVACRGNYGAASILNYFLFEQEGVIKSVEEKYKSANYPYRTNDGCFATWVDAFQHPVRLLVQADMRKICSHGVACTMTERTTQKRVNDLIDWGYLSAVNYIRPRLYYMVHTERLLQWVSGQFLLGNTFLFQNPVIWYFPPDAPKTAFVGLSRKVRAIQTL
jgi:hypothetical protein